MDPYLAEVRAFAGNFAPVGWAFCQGQLLSIAENDALFSIIGTTYGGDGQETFALPNLCSRIAVHTGQGSGLTNVILGEASGTETRTLIVNQIPAHSHTLNASANGPTVNTAAGNLLASQSRSNGETMPNIYADNSNPVAMGNSAIGVAGGSQPFDIRQPYLGMNYIICVAGIYPSRN